MSIFLMKLSWERALTKIFNTPSPAEEKIFLENIDVPLVRQIIDESPDGYLEPAIIQRFLMPHIFLAIRQQTEEKKKKKKKKKI